MLLRSPKPKSCTWIQCLGVIVAGFDRNILQCSFQVSRIPYLNFLLAGPDAGSFVFSLYLQSDLVFYFLKPLPLSDDSWLRRKFPAQCHWVLTALNFLSPLVHFHRSGVLLETMLHPQRWTFWKLDAGEQVRPDIVGQLPRTQASLKMLMNRGLAPWWKV